MPYVDDIDLVLFMSVTPGEGGQEFKEEVNISLWIYCQTNFYTK